MTIQPWMTTAAEKCYRFGAGDRATEAGDFARIIAECAPRVRTLEWVTSDEPTAYANSRLGSYTVWTFDDETGTRAYMRRKGEHGGTLLAGVTTLEAAKAAAQADFEQRVADCFEQPNTGEQT